MPAAVGEVLVFSLQPEVRHDVIVESIRLTGASSGLEAVALGYRPLSNAGTLDKPTDPSTVRAVKGLALSAASQQPFVALVRTPREGIFSVTGFDVRYRQGLVRHRQHYSDAFAIRSGTNQAPVTEVRFVGCSIWQPTR